MAFPTFCIEGIIGGGGERDFRCVAPMGRRIGGRVFCSMYEGANFGEQTGLL